MGIKQTYDLFCSLRTELLVSIQKTIKPSQEDFAVLIEHALGGSIKFADAYAIKYCLDKYKPQTVLEVGSFLGFSARWILECSAPWQCIVTALDPNIRHRIFSRPKDILIRFNEHFTNDRLDIVTAFMGFVPDRIRHYYPDESSADPSLPERMHKEVGVIDRTWDKRFDLIFIDGDHSYNACKDNFETCIHLLNPGGVILFHDAISWEGVNKYIMELKTQHQSSAEVEILDLQSVYRHPGLESEPVKGVDGIGVYTKKE